MSTPAADRTDSSAGGKGLRIETFTLGMWATNCYLLYEARGEDGAAAGGECWIVDAGFGPGPIAERIAELRLSPSGLVLTHAHIDHIAGVNELLARFPGCRLLIHEAEEAWLTDPMLNLSAAIGMPVTARRADQLLHHGDALTLGSHTWAVLHTPGHSPGGITLHCAAAGVALVGDALFAGSIGRTDFPGCSLEKLAESIRTQLYTLPGRTAVYPGHGPPTTIEQERRSNPFVRG